MPIPAPRSPARLLNFVYLRSPGKYVLLPAEKYAVVASLFEADELSSDEAVALMEPVASAAGWLDPALDVYDNYDANYRTNASR